MKKLFNLFGFVLFLLTLVNTAFAENLSPVELLYARAEVRSEYLTGYVKASGYIEVENIAYHKTVTVWYSKRGDDEWQGVQASYVGPTHDNYEKWYFETDEHVFSPRLGVDFQFAIKYEVAGQTYWDNNEGKDYKVGNGTRYVYPNTTIGRMNVIVNDYSGYPWPFTIRVKVKNIAYHKVVKVVYTTDNWATVNEAFASYSYMDSEDNDLEDWFASTMLPQDISHIEFAVSYEVNGQTYWDNNEGYNYRKDF